MTTLAFFPHKWERAWVDTKADYVHFVRSVYGTYICARLDGITFHCVIYLHVSYNSKILPTEHPCIFSVFFIASKMENGCTCSPLIKILGEIYLYDPTSISQHFGMMKRFTSTQFLKSHMVCSFPIIQKSYPIQQNHIQNKQSIPWKKKKAKQPQVNK